MSSKSDSKKTQEQINQEKKARVMGQKKGSSRIGLVLAAAVVLALAGGAAWWVGGNSVTAPTAPPASTASAPAAGQAQSQAVVIPAAQFDDHKARHFSHQTPDGLTVRFFVLKSSDGVIRAAFDACDVCWPSNKGYSQDGDVMICNNCGRRFVSVRINEVKGGCNPAPLARTVKDGQVVILVKDIEAGQGYFDFRKQQG